MIRFKVNRVDRSFDADPEMPLLWYLRDILSLQELSFGSDQKIDEAMAETSATVEPTSEFVRRSAEVRKKRQIQPCTIIVCSA